MDCSPPGSSVHGILQAGILEGVAISPGNLSDPGIEPISLLSPTLAGGFFTASTTGSPEENTIMFQLSSSIKRG